MEKSTHYRRVFKSDHLGSADLEEFIEDKKSLIFTIKNVTQHVKDPMIKGSGISVAGKMISANIAHFKEDIKPMVINATNSKTMKSFAKSAFTKDWNNITVELYIDASVKMKGEIVGGIKIKRVQPTIGKPTFAMANFKTAKEKGATIEDIKKIYEIDSATEKAYNEYGTGK